MFKERLWLFNIKYKGSNNLIFTSFLGFLCIFLIIILALIEKFAIFPINEIFYNCYALNDWELYFPNNANQEMETIIEIYNDIMNYLLFILALMWMILVKLNENKFSNINLTYWTLIVSIILTFILNINNIIISIFDIINIYKEIEIITIGDIINLLQPSGPVDPNTLGDGCGCAHGGNNTSDDWCICEHNNIVALAPEDVGGLRCCECGGENPTYACNSEDCACVFHSNCNGNDNNNN